MTESMSVDILTFVDMMLAKVPKRSKGLAVEFCRSRAKVCASGCRTAVVRETTLLFGFGERS